MNFSFLTRCKIPLSNWMIFVTDSNTYLWKLVLMLINCTNLFYIGYNRHLCQSA